MSLSMGQVTATSTAATVLCHVPSGPCLVTITNDSLSATTAYVATTPSTAAGTLATITSANGIPVPAGQSLVFARYPTNSTVSLSVITGSTTATVGWLISSTR